MFANIGIYLVVYLTSNTISCSYEMQITTLLIKLAVEISFKTSKRFRDSKQY